MTENIPTIVVMHGDQTGEELLLEALRVLQPFWQRSETLPKWDVTVLPS